MTDDRSSSRGNPSPPGPAGARAEIRDRTSASRPARNSSGGTRAGARPATSDSSTRFPTRQPTQRAEERRRLPEPSGGWRRAKRWTGSLEATNHVVRLSAHLVVNAPDVFADDAEHHHD